VAHFYPLGHMSLRSSLIGFALGALATFPVLWLAMLLCQVNYGLYTAPKALFPFAMFSADFPKDGSVGCQLGAYLQLPVYGLVLGAVYHSARFRAVALAVAALHLIAAAVLPLIQSHP
jgi:hypothetical protein